MPGAAENTADQRYPGTSWIAIGRSAWGKLSRSRMVSWSISGSCVIGFVLWARSQPMPQLPEDSAQAVALVIAILAYGASMLGACERWSLLLRAGVPGISRVVSYRPVVLGQFGNMFLPARAGDAIRVGLAAASDERASAQTAVGCLIAERALDIACHVTLLTVVLTGMVASRFGVLVAVRVAGAALVAVTIATGATVVLRAPVRTVLTRVLGAGSTAAFLGALLEPLRGLRYRGVKPVVLTIAMWTGEVAGWWAASHAVGLNLSAPQAAYVFAVASLAMVMPVGFGAIGTLDAGILFALHTIDVSTVRLLSFVLLLRVLLVLPGFALFAATVRGPRDRRR